MRRPAPRQRSAPACGFPLTLRALPRASPASSRKTCPFFPRPSNLALEQIRSSKTTTPARGWEAALQKGGGAPRGPRGAPGRPLRRGLLTGAVAPTPPVGQPWGPAPSRLGLPDEPRSRSLPHPSVNPLHFLSQTFYELPGPKAPACQFTRRTPHLRVSELLVLRG